MLDRERANEHGGVSASEGHITQYTNTQERRFMSRLGGLTLPTSNQGRWASFLVFSVLRVCFFSANKRDTQAVKVALMDTKVEPGDEATAS